MMDSRDRSTTRLTSRLQRKAFVPVMTHVCASGLHAALACTEDVPVWLEHLSHLSLATQCAYL